MSPARLASKLWTPLDDERLRSLAVSGLNVREIAAELERTVSAVRARAERFGISLKRVMVARRHPR
jgi:DNA-directed RNA polymerase specialized sigma24 family protein